MSSYPSLDEYTFDLRSGLRDAAKVGLMQLQEMIGDLGYGWLDGHMESIMERTTSRAPMAELMKTPSRTQTVKKTRAITTAMKERTDKISRINMTLGSPMSKTSPMRAPLSPLQPRAINNNVTMLSPSPVKAKPLTPAKSPLRKQATLSKKGTPKSGRTLVVPGDENARYQNEDQGDIRMLSPTPKKPASKTNKDLSRGDQSASTSHAQSVNSLVAARDTSPAPARAAPASPRSKPVDVLPNVLPKEADVFASAPVVAVPILDRAKANDEKKSLDKTDQFSLPDTSAVQSVGTEREQPKPTQSVPANRSEAEASDAPKSSSHPLRPTFASSSSTTNVPRATTAPQRQVRSSWLSKALGNGTVPITDMAGVRKSYAAPSGRPTTGPLDFAALRKSLAPVGGLSSGAGVKRPSEGAEEDEDEEDKRPEKIFRTEQKIQPADKEQTKSAAVPLSIALNDLGKSTKTISAVEAPTPSTSQTKSQPHPALDTASPATALQTETQIHKVSKALDDLQKRAAQKEAHRQKAALTASGGPRQTTSSHVEPHTTATPGQPSGFLKNLGSLGMGLGRSLGLGGTARNAEEEALRLQEELEEEQRAEAEAKAELERLMSARDHSRVEQAANVDEDMVVDEKRSDEIHVDEGVEKVAEKEREIRSTTVEREQQDEEDVAEVLEEDLEPIARQVEVATVVANEPREQVKEPMRVNSTPEKVIASLESTTTPPGSPPKRVFSLLSSKTPVAPIVTSAPSIALEAKNDMASAKSAQSSSIPGTVRRQETEEDEDEEEEEQMPELPEPIEADDEKTDTEFEEEVEEEDTREVPAKKMFKSKTEVINRPTLPSAQSTNSLASLAQSTTSQSSHLLSSASTIAGKTLGFKPTVGAVKSVQLANAAAKKSLKERRLQLREQAEQRKAEVARQKAEEERIKQEEDRKARLAEVEEKRRIRLEAEKKRKEKEEKNLMVAREKALKEEAERLAAKAKAEEENKKRKLAQAALNKSSGPAFKKIGPATGSSGLQTKPKEPLRPIKPVMPSSAMPSNNLPGGSKLGPTSFRTAELVSSTSTTTVTNATNSTITLVQPRAPLGPPSRASSQMPMTHPYPSFQPQMHVQHGTSSSAQIAKPAVVLQQSRVHLQTQLDERALEIQSEDIVLPDIASEYSDSDDSDKETDFKRPQWAESPNLHAALEAQASRNPDEIFGPIKPLNMEELFKQRSNKFRARTSSANWNGGDRLTRAEEVEYARRMGFKA